MILLTRQGECNRCGSCCGLNADNPWSEGFLDSHMDWQYSEFFRVFPQTEILGLGSDRAGKTRVIKLRGVTKIGKKKFPYVWYKGQPRQDLTPKAKEATPTTRCPFLLDADDSTHPCGLIGTQYENGYQVACSGNGTLDNGVPPNKYSQKNIDRWMTDYPNCSYTWE
jgi:hypothetical protein